MGKETLVGVLLIVLLFLFLTGFIASQLEITLPFSTESISVLDYLWDNFSDWINPFS